MTDHITGFPSIDKPWEKYYTDEQLRTAFVPKSIYQLMRDCNQGYEDDVAIIYYGNSIRFRHVFKMIDMTAAGLKKAGIVRGDTVIMLLPNVPEAMYIFYAVNKIGAVIDVIDPRSNIKNIQKEIEDTNCKLVFMLDMQEQQFRDYNGPARIVYISPFYSMPAVKRCVLNIIKPAHIKTSENRILWKDFLCSDSESDNTVPFIQDENAVIVHTGGSTGFPKGVLHTNESFNALVYQLQNHSLNMHRGDTFLNIIPPFIAIGLDDSLHLAACLGIKQIFIPSIVPENFPNIVRKYRPNILFGGPVHFYSFCSETIFKNEDLSYIRICVTGGDTAPDKLQENVDAFLKSHNSSAKLYNGYGATEMSSGISCSNPASYCRGTVGIPYLNNNLKIVNPEDFEEEYSYNRTGELLVSGPTMMVGYVGDYSSETDKAVYTDKSGTRWYVTEDLAHITEDGHLFIDGRLKRIITRRGFKIYPMYIEKIISEHPAVKNCAVVGIPDPVEYSVPVANIVLKSGAAEADRQDVISYVDRRVRSEISESALMAGYNFLDSLPMTKIGKLDFKALEKTGLVDGKRRGQNTYEI